MNTTEKLNELILESKNHTFQKNCETSKYGTYGQPGIDLQVWIAECEDFIFSQHGKDSTPGRLYSQFIKRNLTGNGQEEFDKQLAILISALKVCQRVAPKIETHLEPVKYNSKKLSQVFIVHGHDEAAKSKTARFIEKLGFEAIILHEQASSSKTIIEKIEEYSNVGFGIILYTPCDIGGKKTRSSELKPRARQNVVFEHGFLIGKINRNNVCALVKGEVETPNDISGVVYITMDESDAWHLKLAKEMKKSGYNIDLNRII